MSTLREMITDLQELVGKGHGEKDTVFICAHCGEDAGYDGAVAAGGEVQFTISKYSPPPVTSASSRLGLDIRHTSIPDNLLKALEREIRYLKYTRPQTLYWCVEPDWRATYVGVWGDGANAAYEWFIWNPESKALRTSNCGYGNPGLALCCGLVESGAEMANGDHDLFLTWTRRDRGTSPE